LENLGLVGGRASISNALGSVASGAGGGLHNSGGEVSLVNVTFSGNVATGFPGRAGDPNGNDEAGTDGSEGMGGALYSLGGSLTASNCIFLANAVVGGAGGAGGNGRTGGLGANGGDGGDGGGGRGAAVYLKDTMATFTGCLFTNNTATGGVGAAGGLGSGLLGFNGVNGNAGWAGGGAIFHESGSLRVTSSTFARNSATGVAGSVGKAVGGSLVGEAGTAGGAALGGAAVSLASATFENCTFWENSVTGGAGGDGGNGSTFSFGFDGGRGGGGGVGMGGALHVAGGVLVHNTFSNNSAVGGAAGKGGAGSGFVGRAGSPGSAGLAGGGAVHGVGAGPILANSVVAAAASGGGVSGGLVDMGGNVVSDSSPLLTHSTTLVNTSPGVANILGANGGPTPTLGLAAGSLAINRGVDSFCLAVDQRGTNRVDFCDAGAFEAAPTNLPLLHLAVSTTRAGQLRLAWPANYSRAVVEESATLVPAAWSAISAASVVEGASRVVVIQPPSLGARYYRVRN